MLTWENTTRMALIESTLTLVTHNTVFNVELSSDNHIADSFLKRLIAEFNQQQHSPSADVTKPTVTLKRDALPLLASNSNVIEKQVTVEMFYEPVTTSQLDYQFTIRCTKCSCYKSKLLNDLCTTEKMAFQIEEITCQKGSSSNAAWSG